MAKMEFKGNWIEGRLCGAVSGSRVKNMSAVDGDVVLYEFADSSQEDVIGGAWT